LLSFVFSYMFIYSVLVQGLHNFLNLVIRQFEELIQPSITELGEPVRFSSHILKLVVMVLSLGLAMATPSSTDSPHTVADNIYATLTDAVHQARTDWKSARIAYSHLDTRYKEAGREYEQSKNDRQKYQKYGILPWGYVFPTSVKTSSEAVQEPVSDQSTSTIAPLNVIVKPPIEAPDNGTSLHADADADGSKKRKRSGTEVPIEAPDNTTSLDADVDANGSKKRKRSGTKLPIEERKRMFIDTPTPEIEDAIQSCIQSINRQFASEDEGGCWLHPSPPIYKGKATGVISKDFGWYQNGLRHVLRVNIGIVALLTARQLTTKEKEGYIENAWHLSHLCGNWTCCNWRHLTLEAGRINLDRNVCFKRSAVCQHVPACMKHLKKDPLIPRLGSPIAVDDGTAGDVASPA